jgi:tRNA pseudouridine38/39 synthase
MAAYAHLSREQLIDRLRHLEPQFDRALPSDLVGKRRFDINSHPRRKIALKFCYWGSDYSGLAIQDGPTPLPTVESVLFAALSKCRLVDVDAGLEGCRWSRCGRTDKGVSAAGQVVSLWVRSAIGKQKIVSPVADTENPTNFGEIANNGFNALPGITTPAENGAAPSAEEEPFYVQQELNYVHLLNRNLPSSIRVLAWSPVSDEFDARFSCIHRHYKYIFTVGTSPRLDIEAMRDAAARLVGEHDFRNFCKLDPAKQIEDFHRTILRATITPLEHFSEGSQGPTETTDGLFVFDLVGTAFLYHQVRHIMGVLFLIGSGHENPAVIDDLFRTGYSPPSIVESSIEPNERVSTSEMLTSPSFTSNRPLVTTKPVYRMADALPLVLWDCAFREDEVCWQEGNGNEPSVQRDALSNVFREMQAVWTQDIIRTSISSLFLQASMPFHAPLKLGEDASEIAGSQSKRYHLGSGSMHTDARYVPLLERERGGSIEEANAKWRAGARGKKNAEKLAKRAADRAATAANFSDAISIIPYADNPLSTT